MAYVAIFFQRFLIFYFAALTLIYILINISAYFHVRKYLEHHRLHYELPRFFSGFEPWVSILVPAYNEESTVVNAAHALLQLFYPHYEVIIINDGSNDDTLEVLKNEFKLIPFPEIYGEYLKTSQVRGIYYSTEFPKLRVIDKENAGKADALNAGINLSRGSLICSIDSDSVLSRDSLIRIVQPFLEDPTTVATGGQVRILNGCEVQGGRITKVGLPKNLLALFQVVEYLRAFLFGRIGWSPLNAVGIISGAFGLFDKETVINVGGYKKGTVGEDMELVLRIHRVMRQEKKRYRIAHVPDPICWTEVPEDLGSLKTQRIRWQRGLAESLTMNIKLLFNPSAGTIGWLSFPFMVIFELLSPIVEAGGFIFLLLAVFFHFLSLASFLVYLFVAFGSGMLLSATGILLEEITFHVYKDFKSIFVLFGASLLETPFYRIINSFWRLIGLFQWLFGTKSGWGKIKRKPRQKAQPASPAPSIPPTPATGSVS